MREWVMMYKAVVQTVFLYGSDRWVVTVATLTVPDCFHCQVSRQTVGKTAGRAGDVGWEWPPVKEALDVASKNTFGGSMPPLRQILTTGPYMNYAWRRKICLDLEDS